MKTGLSIATIVFLVLATVYGPAPGKVKTVTVKVRVDNEAPGYEGVRAMDGNPATIWHTRWAAGETRHPHEIIVDLGKSYEISGFGYLPRSSGGLNGTIKAYECYVSDNPKKFGKPVTKGVFPKTSGENVIAFPAKTKGRYVRLRALSELAGQPWTSIAELRIISDGVRFRAGGRSGRAIPMPARRPQRPLTEMESQYNALVRDLRNRARFAKYADQTFRREASILTSDRDPADIVLRRTAALLADLKRMPSAPDLRAMEAELKELQAAGGKIDASETESRLELFKKACAVRRKIAFANPLLDFDKILFIKHHRSIYNHMCDQYYGITACPGGGLYVLSDPFGAEPKVRDVLADSVVQRGRLKGQKLDGGPKTPPRLRYNGVGGLSGDPCRGGSFLSPDLSYDAREALFAYVECKGRRTHDTHTDASRGHWDPGQAWHVFKVNIDGTDLVQLTDGTFNDFDPCYLPNGRVAFISERRGGYLRCGRVCPTYTMFDMAADGNDIRCLSFHETNEWHPSVTNDGRIIWTRWDYVDRFGCTAHMPWITSLEGRDPRAVHGNFSARRSRPDMEVNVRAIPGSHKYIAIAAPHHGQAYGSIILIDPAVEDDDAMSPLKRITPDVAFPESQGGAQVYGTPWALSEDYYLCVYDASMRPGAGRQGRGHTPGNYGIYLADAFGNKELIYRDPQIGCLDPIPVKPRPVPPVAPSAVKGGTSPARADFSKPSGEATIAVMDVYESFMPWPKGTKITALRVMQVLPMSVGSGVHAHETGLRLPTAGDSVVPCRYVLGTAPVEADGSAHFIVPAEREIFFQAVDASGLAVQSMRSATYLQKGEMLTCQGCHEPKPTSPRNNRRVPLALKRGPSRLKPDVDGSNPFSYPRLVQPVLDKHCVKCHAKNPKKAPDLTRKIVRMPRGRGKVYASYASLAPKYGFWQYGNGLRTTPGKFGAKASKLYQMLSKGHNKLKLPPEDMHRITLWLDCVSMFYGVYEKEGGEAQLRGEIVRPTLE